MRTVTVQSRLGEINGYGNDDIVYFDLYDPGASKNIRHFVLLKYNIKLMYEPWGWIKEWYADLISIEYLDKDYIKLTDLYLDIVIEENGPTYRMIDFEDLAKALIIDEVKAVQLEQPLTNLQLFLDDHLHKGKDFPPSVIRPYLK